jgi:hypothetical protein
MSKPDYYEAHLTLTGGLTETVAAERLYDLITLARHATLNANVEGYDVERIAILKVFGTEHEAGPFKLVMVED